MAVSAVYGPLFGQVRFSRIGVRLAELHNKGYRWQHEAVIAFAAPQHAFELTLEEAEEWYRGRGVYPQAPPAQDGSHCHLPGRAAGPGQARRLPSEEQLPARAGTRWETFCRQGVTPRKKYALLTGGFPPLTTLKNDDCTTGRTTTQLKKWGEAMSKTNVRIGAFEIDDAGLPMVNIRVSER